MLRASSSPLLAALLIALWLPPCAIALTRYEYRVVERLPQSRNQFVQGLEIVDGWIYLGTGLRGQSTLQRFALTAGTTGTPQTRIDLNPRLFGEGITVMGDKVYQLTWQAGLGAIYDRESLSQQAWFRIPGQGWGLCNNGRELIYSDGSHRLYFLSPEDFTRSRTLEVTLNGKRLPRLNELEWVDGQIWANVWGSEQIVMIDPNNGAVKGIADLKGLLPVLERRPGHTDVLNGIARDPATGAIWVTGKRWPWLYHIELDAVVEPQAPPDKRGESR